MDFDDIRPYNEAEFKGVLNRLLTDGELESLLHEINFPFLHELRSADTISSFQDVALKFVEKAIIERSTDGITSSGLENLVRDNHRGFLFISNHRDIVLDPALINYVLWSNGHGTTQIAIGDNLLTSQLITGLIRLNKSFIVKRNLPRRAQLEALNVLSSYIWKQIKAGDSVWIAQREGRAKDGNDFTNHALIGMLYLSQRKKGSISFSDYINQLNIVPVSISYEYDPCDVLKAKELYEIALNGNYQKAMDEDKKSMVLGITGYKGHVHIHFGTPLLGDFPDIASVAAGIDLQIIKNYHLWDTNYAAFAALTGEESPGQAERVLYSDKPNLPKKGANERFRDRVMECPQRFRKLLLEMYANPVRNKHEYPHLVNGR